MVHHSTIPYQAHEPINLAYPRISAEALAVWIPSEHGSTIPTWWQLTEEQLRVPSMPDMEDQAMNIKKFPESEVGSLLEKISKNGKILR